MSEAAASSSGRSPLAVHVLVYQVLAASGEEATESSDSFDGYALDAIGSSLQALRQTSWDYDEASLSSSVEKADGTSDVAAGDLPSETGSDSEAVKLLPSNDVLHAQGKCTPCRYFRFREDGCRQGSACSFCHLCTAKESLAGQKLFKHQRQREKMKSSRRKVWQ
ncbi:hypothetical protein AK812_SmicGene1030 [Symbiodinium microadriaticum]|uniref:C3H1-type domain-containing protein n=1 Tax=Symbiodinium microadriaticum TaxID=2951 RepID=A0A1Q9F594_SYMMI|nr:hypothetical protein AK812_SmicGene1030 [Symbiodinium microadriaticum]